MAENLSTVVSGFVWYESWQFKEQVPHQYLKLRIQKYWNKWKCCKESVVGERTNSLWNNRKLPSLFSHQNKRFLRKIYATIGGRYHTREEKEIGQRSITKICTYWFHITITKQTWHTAIGLKDQENKQYAKYISPYVVHEHNFFLSLRKVGSRH